MPVPFSPVMRILASVAATRSTTVRICAISALAPQNIGISLRTGFVAFLPFSLELSSAFNNVSISLSLFHGFTTKSYAPCFIAFTARSISAYAVKRTTFSAGYFAFASLSQKIPSLPVFIPALKFISSNNTSGCSAAIVESNVVGEESVATFAKYPPASNFTADRIFLLSSTISNVPLFAIARS